MTDAETPRDPLELEPGTIFEGRYRLEEMLGRGGFGAVYRATQLPVDRPVALKVLVAELASEPLEVKRFEQEAKIIAGLDHPHIVKLIELGQTDDGRLFLAMEYLEGASLAQIARTEGPLEPRRVQVLGEQVLDALAEAHDRGVVHRDLKLENLFVTRHPRRGEAVKLLDFGIAKIPESNEVLTRKGLLIGSPKTMAPEQILKQPITPQTDLYAFGVVAYELLTGRPPFPRSSRYAIMQAHVNEPPPHPEVEGKRLGGPLIDLVMQCLEKEPADRPASAHALLQAWRAATLPSVLPDADAPTLAVQAPLIVPKPARRDPTRRSTPDAQAVSAELALPERKGDRRTLPSAPPPKPPGRGKALWLALAGVVVVGGGVTAAVVASGGSGAAPTAPVTAPTREAAPAATEAPPPPATAEPATREAAAPATTARATAPPTPAPPPPCEGRMRDGFCLATPFTDASGVRWIGIGNALWMMQAEATTGHYRACVAANACDGTRVRLDDAGTQNPLCHYNGEPSVVDKLPMNCVSYDDAVAYCTWIGGRLPLATEVVVEQWDGGARRKYPWGDEPPSCEVTVMASSDGTLGCGRGDTWVGCEHPRDKTPNGICDLGGNLAEWMDGTVEGQLARFGPEGRIITGGSMRFAMPDMFLTNEVAVAPRTARDFHAGFRCVRLDRPE